jgi:cytochrome c1
VTVRVVVAVRAAAAVVSIVGALTLAACSSNRPSRESPPQVPHGDPAMGVQLIEQFGCGSCHVIPGVRQAVGTVGPPLTDFGRRGFIAGQLPNNASNLIHWIMDPQEVEPGTAMPDLNVSETQARDIAAYLLGLR